MHIFAAAVVDLCPFQKYKTGVVSLFYPETIGTVKSQVSKNTGLLGLGDSLSSVVVVFLNRVEIASV